MRNRALTVFLKLAIAAGVLWLMWRGGRFQPSVVAQAASRWPELLLVAALICVILLLCGVRWWMLLRGQGIFLGWRQTAALTMIGVLFSAVIPGAVSGDVVKGYYIAGEVGKKRGLALATILMDRVIGLCSLAAVASAGVIWNHDVVLSSRTLKLLSAVALGGCFAGVAALLAAVFASGALLDLAHRLPAHLPGRAFAVRTAEVMASYRGQAGRLVAAFVLSLPVHLSGCAAMLVCLHAVGESSAMPASLVLFAFPLGMLAVAIPITPVGIGVGQAAFYAVCNMAAPGSGPAGANAFTVYQAVQILIYLTGLAPYLAYKKRMADPGP